MSDGKLDWSPEYHEDGRDDTRLPGTGETPEKMSAGRYLATRFSTLKPPMDRVENPITVLRLLSSKQWLFFLCAFIAWTWDAFGKLKCTAVSTRENTR
jgi:SHS family lactate transporter-like MFS transporter